MRTWGLVVVVVVGGVGGVGSASAEEFDHTKQETHRGQLGLHAQTGFGFRFIAPYDEEFCGQASDEDPGQPAEVCSGRSPLTLELGAAYGITEKLELLVEARLGLESDFGPNVANMDDGPRQFALAPGIKIYHRDAGLMKFFSTLQFSIDITDYEQNTDTDYGVRNVNGLQFDFHRTTGLYFFFGETMAFSRWFRFEFDAGLGMQARFP